MPPTQKVVPYAAMVDDPDGNVVLLTADDAARVGQDDEGTWQVQSSSRRTVAAYNASATCGGANGPSLASTPLTCTATARMSWIASSRRR